MARRLVIAITDEKLRDTLDGVVPVEVIPFAHARVGREIRRMGAGVLLREGGGKDGPVITDNGNFILDCNFGKIEDPCNLERVLNEITGVVENGIFSRYPKKTVVVIGGPEGIRIHSY
ncbi:ribose-5-phosphate isomerase A, partial [Methanothrix sp.]|uniref:ribose-5-phosphate isomerase A n=1 Tax=Methanothrix sp. TaxID=90426 RepID=UPI0034E26743